MKICKCGKKVLAREMCAAHYAHWNRETNPGRREREREASRKYGKRKHDEDPDYYKKNYIKNRQYNLEKSRKHRYKKYGMTLEGYQEFLKAHNYQCDICQSSDIKNKTWKSFPVDHNHTTGVIRGLLCNSCNRGIGYLQESVEIMEKAMQYLQKE